jgi:hypothetical protein
MALPVFSVIVILTWLKNVVLLYHLPIEFNFCEGTQEYVEKCTNSA